jgi:hypothetical protein
MTWNFISHFDDPASDVYPSSQRVHGAEPVVPLYVSTAHGVQVSGPPFVSGEPVVATGHSQKVGSLVHTPVSAVAIVLSCAWNSATS